MARWEHIDLVFHSRGEHDPQIGATVKRPGERAQRRRKRLQKSTEIGAMEVAYDAARSEGKLPECDGEQIFDAAEQSSVWRQIQQTATQASAGNSHQAPKISEHSQWQR